MLRRARGRLHVELPLHLQRRLRGRLHTGAPTFLGPESAQRTGSPRLPLLTPSPRRAQLRTECANVIENQLHELVPEFDRFQAKCEAPVGAEATSGGSKADWGTLQTLEDIQNLRDEVAYLRAKDIQKERRITALEASVAQLLSAAPHLAGAPPAPPAPPPPPAEVVCTEGTAIPYSDRSEENPCSGTAGTVCEFTCDEHFVKACEQRAEDGSCAREAPHVCGEDGTFSGGEPGRLLTIFLAGLRFSRRRSVLLQGCASW